MGHRLSRTTAAGDFEDCFTCWRAYLDTIALDTFEKEDDLSIVSHGADVW